MGRHLSGRARLREVVRVSANLIGLGETAFHYRWRFASDWNMSFHAHHDQDRLLFIHIPKNGGTATHEAIFGFPPIHGHVPASAFYRQDPKKFSSYRKVAILRDPVERFCSGFWYQKRTDIHASSVHWARRHLDGIQTPSELVSAMKNSWFRTNLLSWVLFASQIWFLRLPGKPLSMDYVGNTENMARASREISELLGWQIEIPKANSFSRPFNEDLNEQEKRRIRDWYSEDQGFFETHPV